MTTINPWHDELGHIGAVLMDWSVDGCMCILKARKEGVVLSDEGDRHIWRLRPPRLKGLKTALVTKTNNWDGDAFGNEWTVHLSIYFCPADESDDRVVCYEIYAEDGKGNGDLVGTKKTLLEAINACQAGELF